MDLHLWPLMWHTYEACVQVGLSQNIETAWVNFREPFAGPSALHPEVGDRQRYMWSD